MGGVVGSPCDFSVSPWSKSFFFPFFLGLLFNLGVRLDRGLDLDLDQGLTIKIFIISLLTSSYPLG